jgi:hypothetical protein
MISFDADQLQLYLYRRFGASAQLLSYGAIGEQTSGREPVKRLAYGRPVLIEFRMQGEVRKVVLETVSPGPFGHEHRADRAQAILWDYDTYDRLPRHVRALGVGAFTKDNDLVPLDGTDELFLITEFIEGRSYHLDLERLAAGAPSYDLDLERMRVLAEYLSKIHQLSFDSPSLYRRKLREIVGHGECIMGLTDSYPLPYEHITARRLRSIEDAANRWRWRLHDRVGRLCQVHGDFHPWNILFREGVDFSVLDRSRGEWGEPADDVTALSINYLFFSLRRHGRLANPFEALFQGFWDRYLELSGDEEVLRAAPLFFAFRGLVLAHPLWYPDLSWPLRQAILCFVENVLLDDRFDPASVNRYCEV